MSVYRITGKEAAIDGLTCLREWSGIIRGLDTAAVCSASAGAVLRVEGNADWMVRAVGYGVPPKYPGEKFTFTGSDRDGAGWQSADDGAIVSKVKIFCPIERGKIIYYHLDIAGNGEITKGSYSASDSTAPNPLSAKGLSFSMDGATVYGVEHWELEIDGNLTDPSWPGHLDGWAVRDEGNVDASLMWRQTFDAAGQIPEVNSFHTFQPYVTATTNYDISWGQVLEEPVQYPIEGNPPGKAEYVRAQITARFTGWKDSVQGYIKKPGGSNYWPSS